MNARAWRAAAGCALFVYFVAIRWPSLGSYFTGDDLMNLYQYWALDRADWARSARVLFLDRYRPAGALLYLSSYWAVGFDPWPLHAALALLQAANVILWWRLCLRWVSLPAAFLSAGAFAYHAGMAELHWSAGTVYDTLVVFATLSGARLFLAIVWGGASAACWAGFLAVTWLGISSKEHFVAFPLILAALLVMEQRIPARAAVAALGLATASVVSAAAWRYLHDDFLLRLGPYVPRFDRALIWSNAADYWQWAALHSARRERWYLLFLAISLAWVIRARRPGLVAGLICWVAAAIAPLLVIAPRSGFVLYLAWPAAALLLALGFEWLRRWPRAATLAVLLLLAKWTAINRAREPAYVQACRRDQAVNRAFSRSVPCLPVHTPDKPVLLITSQWLADQWEPWFAARLVTGRMDTHMDRARTVAEAPRPIDQYTAVLVFDGTRLSRLR